VLIVINNEQDYYMKVHMAPDAEVPDELLGECMHLLIQPHGFDGYYVIWTTEEDGTRSVYFPRESVMWYSFDGIPGTSFEVSGNVTVSGIGG